MMSSTKPRHAGRSSKSREARSNAASASALLRWPWALSIEPVLVADAWIVAGRRHAVMGAERLLARRQILLGVSAQITEGSREAVAAVLLGNAAERPQSVLQPFGQSDKAFAAEHDMGVFKARERQAEVIKSAVEELAGDGDAEIGHFSEVRQSHPARRMLLAKDDLPIRTVHHPPSPDAPLERPPRSGAQVRMAAEEFLEDGDRLSPGAAFNIGMTSLSQTSAKGSARRRSRRAFFWPGSRGSFSMR